MTISAVSRFFRPMCQKTTIVSPKVRTAVGKRFFTPHPWHFYRPPSKGSDFIIPKIKYSNWDHLKAIWIIEIWRPLGAFGTFLAVGCLGTSVGLGAVLLQDRKITDQTKKQAEEQGHKK